MLMAEGLVKRFGSSTVLSGLDLRVQSGEIVGLIGHNGAGKSTFVNIVAGLLRPEGGRVLLDGHDVRLHPRKARSVLGLAPQYLGLYPNATGRDNLRLFGGMAGLRGKRLRERIDELCEAMGLSHVLDRPVAVLSGGQQRRLQAATALLHDPSVIVLDEPTVGADIQARQALLALVRGHAERGAAICYTTHYLSELDDLGASLAVLGSGKVIRRGTREELLNTLPSKLRLRLDTRHAGRYLADHPGREVSTDGEVTIPTHRPAEDLAHVLRELGTASHLLTGVEVVAPDLDDLYRHIVTAGAAEASKTAGGAPHAR